MKREKITIDRCTLNAVLDNMRGDYRFLEKADPQEVAKYVLIDKKINSVDEEDGGADYTVIIERKLDGKFFSLDFQEWDIWWEYSNEDDMPNELEEVFPEQKTVTIYK